MRSLPNVAIVRIAAVCSTVAATAFAGPGVSTASAHSPGHNGLPTAAAAAAGQPLSVSVGLTTSQTEKAIGYVSAASSYPITNYHLDFGDGTSIDQAGPGFQHVYPASSVWKITATVTDSTGATATAIAYFDSVVPSTMTRVAGLTRYDTSTSTSRLVWADAVGDPQNKRLAQAVVLASGANFPDALAGVPLAEYKQGPLLLTEPNQLTDTTRWEIHRVLARGGTVYVLGGESALSPAVTDTLTADGFHVVRYGGATRYETALIIAKQGLNDPTRVIVATGKDYADALAAGPAACGSLSVNGKPAAILLSDDGTIDDPATAAYISRKFTAPGPGTPGVTAAGFQAAVATIKLMETDNPEFSSQWVPALIRPGKTVVSAFGGWSSQTRTVLFAVGTDRYVTAAAMAGFDNQGGEYGSLNPYAGYASGAGFADALTGGAQIATLHGRLLLTAPGYVPDVVTAYFSAPQPNVMQTHIAEVFGGTQAVSQPVEDQLAARLAAKEQ